MAPGLRLTCPAATLARGRGSFMGLADLASEDGTRNEHFFLQETANNFIVDSQLSVRNKVN